MFVIKFGGRCTSDRSVTFCAASGRFCRPLPADNSFGSYSKLRCEAERDNFTYNRDETSFVLASAEAGRIFQPRKISLVRY
ncbi:MAG: hypothetical protein ACTS6G_02690 [Candidatus Hodgkinia cicadicola]